MSRRKAREMALQTLFALEFNKVELDHALQHVVEERQDGSGEKQDVSDREHTYTEVLLRGVTEHLSEIDKVISEVSTHWKLDRMGAIDRNIARIAIFEMRYGAEELTPNVVINEAVEIAKTFGSEESSRFINGILGNLVKREYDKEEL